MLDAKLRRGKKNRMPLYVWSPIFTGSASNREAWAGSLCPCTYVHAERPEDTASEQKF